MRGRLFFSLLAAVAGCSFSDADDPYRPRMVDFDVYKAEELGLWAQVKPACAAYHYERVSLGANGTVTIQIADDRPQWRWYFINVEAGKPPVEWVERDAAIGTHPDLPPASTIEQLWDECGAVVHSACPQEQPLQATAEGVISGCLTGSQPRESECPLTGIILRNFKCGRLEPPAGLD